MATPADHSSAVLTAFAKKLLANIMFQQTWPRRSLVQRTHSHIQKQGTGEVEVEVPPPLPMTDLPPALSSTLQHIVGKLDMMTQVIGMVEERLSLNEDRMTAIEERMGAALEERLALQEAQISKLAAMLGAAPAEQQGQVQAAEAQAPEAV